MTSIEFTNLFHNKRKVILLYCLKLVRNLEDAEDITNDTFLKFWHQRDEINMAKADNYLITIAKNKCYDFGRHKLVKAKFMNQYNLDELIQPFQNDIEGDITPCIHCILEELPPVQKQLVKLQYIDGYQPKEISKLLGRNRTTVRTQISTGLSNIRKKLKNRGFHLG